MMGSPGSMAPRTGAEAATAVVTAMPSMKSRRVIRRPMPRRRNRSERDSRPVDGTLLTRLTALGTLSRSAGPRKLAQMVEGDRYLFGGGTGTPAIFTLTEPRWFRLVK